MSKSSLKKLPVIETHQRVVVAPITWNSTSNPYASAVLNINEPGWVVTGVSFSFSGSGLTNIFTYRMVYNSETIDYGVRMIGNTPSSLTANSINFIITSIRVS